MLVTFLSLGTYLCPAKGQPDDAPYDVFMSRNLARQISRDLHSNCFAMVLTAGLYSDSRAHNDLKVRVVKYVVVYGQIKAADQKYCHNQKWRRKLKEISFRTLKRFWRQFR